MAKVPGVDGGRGAAGPAERSAAGVVLTTLAAGQFLMTLDTTVMNVSIATVAEDVGTSITGIQTAITAYTLVMASLMITGGKVGALLGRKRAFALGAIVYGAGSLTTALAPNLTVLLLGWSLLEGVGAALIMPTLVALVASNFEPEGRPRAYGLVASAGAVAVAVGPLIGGVFTTYLSWRLVFAGEVLCVAVILVLSRRMADTPGEHTSLDLVGTVLSAAGLGMVVLGVLKSGTWGVVQPSSGGPEWFGTSPVIWLLVGGVAVLYGFLRWQQHLLDRGREPLVDPAMLRVPQLRAGLTAFFFQFLGQAGLFFVIPLYLSVALGLSTIATGVRLLPLSITLLAAASLVPKLWPGASPRRVARVGFGALFIAVFVLMVALDAGAGPEVVTVPLLLAGLGIGALASQLGAVTVSAVADERAGEVGGLQNTVTNLGASIGTALAGAVMISSLTTAFVGGVEQIPSVPPEIAQQAEVQLDAGVPFVSDDQLRAALDAAGVEGELADEVVDVNTQARLDGLRASLAVLALVALAPLFLSGELPDRPPTAPGGSTSETPRAEPEPARRPRRVARARSRT